MQEKMKNYALVTCLFVFLFMIIGGGFHLTPGTALIAAASGTPLVIHAFKHRIGSTHHHQTTPCSLVRNHEDSVGGGELAVEGTQWNGT